MLKRWASKRNKKKKIKMLSKTEIARIDQALKGPFYTIPNGLTREGIHQFFLYVAKHNYPPDEMAEKFRLAALERREEWIKKYPEGGIVEVIEVISTKNL